MFWITYRPIGRIQSPDQPIEQQLFSWNVDEDTATYEWTLLSMIYHDFCFFYIKKVKKVKIDHNDIKAQHDLKILHKLINMTYNLTYVLFFFKCNISLPETPVRVSAFSRIICLGKQYVIYLINMVSSWIWNTRAISLLDF